MLAGCLEKSMDIDSKRRHAMALDLVTERRIKFAAVIRAMRSVPRHLFVEEALAAQAYSDNALPIGFGQTISQPYVVALMTGLLDVREGMSVLEIGTGSGYQSAVLAEMGALVFTVECVPELHAQAKERLEALGYGNVRFKLDDGTLGWPEKAPFDRILVTAGGPVVPAPYLDQLADPGRLVMPVGEERGSQTLVAMLKENGEVRRETHGRVAFVDLVGRHGW